MKNKNISVICGVILTLLLSSLSLAQPIEKPSTPSLEKNVLDINAFQVGDNINNENVIAVQGGDKVYTSGQIKEVKYTIDNKTKIGSVKIHTTDRKIYAFLIYGIDYASQTSRVANDILKASKVAIYYKSIPRGNAYTMLHKLTIRLK